jgi:superfamily II DNA/RNA helicase
VGSIKAVRNKIENKELYISKVKMVIFDEFDEILKVTGNRDDLQKIIFTYFKQIDINPMYLMFSATLDDQTLKEVEAFINQPTPDVYESAKQALKLDNVMQLKIKMADDQAKRKFLENLYLHQPGQAMIFVNTKKTAHFLQELIAKIGQQQGRSL